MSHNQHESQLERHIVEQLAANGWQLDDSERYEKTCALHPQDVLALLQCSRHEAWSKRARLNGTQTQTTLLNRLVKVLEVKDGSTAAMLRDGFAITTLVTSQLDLREAA